MRSLAPPPFLHAADAVAHAPWWVTTLCLAAGVGVGVALTSGGDIVRKLRGGDARPFEVRRWGARDNSFWAEIEAHDGRDAASGSWSLVSDAGPVALTVELLPKSGSRARAGLIGDWPAGQAAQWLEHRPPNGPVVIVALPADRKQAAP